MTHPHASLLAFLGVLRVPLKEKRILGGKALSQFPVAILVFLTRPARTDIITANLLPWTHESLRSGRLWIGIRFIESLFVVRVMVLDILGGLRLLDFLQFRLTTNLYGQQNLGDFGVDHVEH